MAEVVAELSWLLESRTGADIPESYYYLGKALADAGQHKGADRAMTLFIAAVKGQEAKFPLLSDAYCVSAAARSAVGDRKGALAVYGAGLAFVEAERRDQFLYKMGELHMQEGRSREALGMWEKVKSEGSDPVWKKLAVQAIDDFRWREEMKGKIAPLSKK
jgi:tetratricopeptide (TPR) repeat protein